MVQVAAQCAADGVGVMAPWKVCVRVRVCQYVIEAVFGAGSIVRGEGWQDGTWARLCTH